MRHHDHVATLTVYIPAWELRCCGLPITVGEPARWHLTHDVDREWIETLAGAEPASRVTAVYSHHTDEPPTTDDTHGTVRSILAVYCDFGPRPDLGPGHYPVAGSGRVEPVAAVGDRGSGVGGDPTGYIAELETA